MYLTDEQRVVYDADQQRYRKMHPDCDSHRWSMARSRATHCGFCCPPIPMSPEQHESIQRILSGSVRREDEVDIWERRLTCGHTVQQSVHHTNPEPSFLTHWCPECELTRGVVREGSRGRNSDGKSKARASRQGRPRRAGSAQGR